MIIGLSYFDEENDCYAIVHLDEEGPLKVVLTNDTPPCGDLDDKTVLVLVVNSDVSYVPVAKLQVAQLSAEKIEELGLELRGSTASVTGRDAPREIRETVGTAKEALDRMLSDPTRARETYEVLQAKIEELTRIARSHNIH